MAESLNDAVIEAAGGVVERDMPEGRCIAVIYRERYGPEWALPKGKRQPGKSWQQTGLREVEEEVGVRATITGIAGATAYLAGGVPKIVLYWRMYADGAPPPFTPNEEARKLAWLTPHQALERLTHPEEANVLRRDKPEIERYFLAFLTRNLVPILQRRAWKRLRSTLESYRIELEGLKAHRADYAEIDHALTKAEHLLAEGDIDSGWKCFLATQRVSLIKCSDGELHVITTAMRAEAEKLSPSRKTAVLALLKDKEEKKGDGTPETAPASATAADSQPAKLAEPATTNPDAASPSETAKPAEPVMKNPDAARPGEQAMRPAAVKLFHAVLLRDGHYHNEAYRNGLRRSNALWLAIALIAGMAALLYLAAKGHLHQTLNHPQLLASTNMFWELTTVATFGFLGATFSAAIAMPSTHAFTRIPELVSSIRVTLMRLLVGPISAIVIYLAVQSKAYEFGVQQSGTGRRRAPHPRLRRRIHRTSRLARRGGSRG